jgi:hypothetical protein
MRTMTKGNGYIGFLDGTKYKPNAEDANYEASLADWERDSAKVKSWFLRSVEHNISVNIMKYENAKDAWAYLKKVYKQSNWAKRYQLKQKLKSRRQENESIQEFYARFQQASDALTSMLEILKCDRCNGCVEWKSWDIKARDQKQVIDFLMALCPEFDGVRNILHWSFLPSMV